MPENWAPTSVTEWTSGGGAKCWRVMAQKPDGTGHLFVFPKDALEWRMAEYQLDSVDEALDMVLHEPFATDPMDPMHTRDDAAVRVGMVTRAAGPAVDYEAIRLHNADTIEDARAAHRIRIADAKTRIRITPAKGQLDPLDTIRTHHGVTETGLRTKKVLVDSARAAYHGRATNSAPLIDPEASRRTLETRRA